MTIKNITHKELKRLLMYNPWTGLFYWKISLPNYVNIGNIAGSLNKETKYIDVRINNKTYRAHRLAWFYVYGYWPENDIDHKDRVRNHNWIDNLRESSRQCNMRNTGNPITNTSGVKGVYWNKDSDKWRASIRINSKHKSLGSYKDFDEAVCARLAGEQCVDWSGCDSSSPAYQYVKENINKFLN